MGLLLALDMIALKEYVCQSAAFKRSSVLLESHPERRGIVQLVGGLTLSCCEDNCLGVLSGLNVAVI